MHPELFRRIGHLRNPLLSVAQEQGTPVYAYDAGEVERSYSEFTGAFADAGEPVKVFLAMKSNPCLPLLKTVVTQGGGLDASSHRELTLALQAGAQEILFTGPAKKERDFTLVLEHADRITVNLETVRELKLLANMAEKSGRKIRCGLRVITQHQDGWTKFGSPLTELRAFYNEARKHKCIDFCGIHFHISFNTDPQRYVQTLQEVATYMREHFSEEERAGFAYLDIGGGIYPVQTWEGLYPWNEDLKHAERPAGTLEKILRDEYQPRYIPMQIAPIDAFASAIVQAVHDVVRPVLPNVALYTEPGRYLSQNSLHILLTLTDKKGPSMGIADGGNNMLGWEKYQHFWYVPVFNLTHFSTECEIPFLLYGSLCTPDDVWGYYLYCSDVQEGDIICLPYQGAYTFTLAQNFIREVPPVVEL
ncbi:MAG: alanine racemase [Candidatus Peribacteraceae bacterium]|nr:alanine racemase [Candidatus Peribacteraceae bacterium]